MGKTTLKEKIGYGFASLGDATAYGLIGVFLLFFLTTVADISPGVAGTIVATGSIWNAVVNPVIGYFADKVNTKWGRRRPVMLIFSIPLMIMMFLLFTDIQIPPGIKPVYYGILVMMYWTCYTSFFVPYLALGAEYTTDYDDRTVLRLFGSLFNMIGTLLSMVMPTTIVEILQSAGLSESRAWSCMALMLGFIAMITIVVTVIMSKNKDLPCEAVMQNEHRSIRETFSEIFGEFGSVAKLKPMKYLVMASLLGLVGYAMIISDMVYYFTYNMGLTSGQISICMLIRSVLAVIFIPIVGKLAIATDRKNVLIGVYIIGSAGMVIMKFAEFTQTFDILFYVFLVTLCTAIYWQIMPGIFYDICEYDRITNGKSRSATIVSFQGFVEALAVGIGGQILGIILDAAGFDGAAQQQSAEALVWIENSGTVIPVVFLLLSAFALYKYPINKKIYNEMMQNEH